MDDDTHDYSTIVEGDESKSGKPLTRLIWGRLVRVSATQNADNKKENEGNQKNVLEPNVLDIMENEVVFGRNKDCNAVFNDKKVSSKHCKVYRANSKGEVCGDIDDYKVFVDDLSSNGTWVNLKKIVKNIATPLAHGDEISLIAPNNNNNNSTPSISYIFQDMREIEKRNAPKKEREEGDELTQPDDDHLMETSSPAKNPVNAPQTPPFIKKKSSFTGVPQNTTTSPQRTPSSNSITNTPSPKSDNSNSTVTTNTSINKSPTLVKSPTKILSENTTSSTSPSITLTRTTSKEYLTPSPNKKDTSENNNNNNNNNTNNTKSDNNNNNNNTHIKSDESTTTSITRTESDLKRKSSDLLDSTTTTTATTTTTSSTSASESNKRSKMDDMEDNLVCGICQEILYKAVSLVPCLHNFCMCCYGEWSSRSDLCPQCRSKVKSVHKNHAINNLVESYVQANPDKKREKEELDEMDKRCPMTEEMLLSGKSTVKKKKTYDYDEEEEDYSDEDEGSEEEEEVPYRPYTPFTTTLTTAPFTTGFGMGLGGGMFGGGIFRPNCRQCNVAGPDGFKCPAINPVHVYCSSCNLALPDRKNDTQKIRCDLCSKIFCDLYWGCSSHAGNFRQLKDFQLYAIPIGAIFGNTQECQYLTEILRSNSKTVDNMFHEILAMLDDGTQNFRGIPTGINVKSTNYSCLPCANIVLRDMAYIYRTNIQQDQIPKEIKDRPDCHWGKNCRTMQHKPDHAKRFNHICEQTKF